MNWQGILKWYHIILEYNQKTRYFVGQFIDTMLSNIRFVF